MLFLKNLRLLLFQMKIEILGVAKNSSGGTPKNFANYFVIEFSQKFYDYGVWSGSGFKSKNTKLKETCRIVLIF